MLNKKCAGGFASHVDGGWGGGGGREAGRSGRELSTRVDVSNQPGHTLGTGRTLCWGDLNPNPGLIARGAVTSAVVCE